MASEVFVDSLDGKLHSTLGDFIKNSVIGNDINHTLYVEGYELKNAIETAFKDVHVEIDHSMGHLPPRELFRSFFFLFL